MRPDLWAIGLVILSAILSQKSVEFGIKSGMVRSLRLMYASHALAILAIAAAWSGGHLSGLMKGAGL